MSRCLVSQNQMSQCSGLALPKRVRRVRALPGLSQSLFAQFLGVSPATVQAWEQGVKVPAKMACRFMDEILRDPQQWQQRVRQCMAAKTVTA